jgi:hypothetical protein
MTSPAPWGSQIDHSVRWVGRVTCPKALVRPTALGILFTGLAHRDCQRRSHALK